MRWGRAHPAVRVYAGLLVAAAGAAALWLLVCEPANSPAAPRCPTYAWTGILCPGCGALRAAHALLRGNLLEAFRFNPLFVVAAPALGAWLLMQALCAATGLRLRVAPRILAGVGLAAALVLVGFAVARNLPLRCCDPLRPPPDRIGSAPRAP